MGSGVRWQRGNSTLEGRSRVPHVADLRNDRIQSTTDRADEIQVDEAADEMPLVATFWGVGSGFSGTKAAIPSLKKRNWGAAPL